jgi:hypothetical protein
MTRKGINGLFFCNDLFVLPCYDNIVRGCVMIAQIVTASERRPVIGMRFWVGEKVFGLRVKAGGA